MAQWRRFAFLTRQGSGGVQVYVGFRSALGNGVVLGQGLSCLDLRTAAEAPSTASARKSAKVHEGKGGGLPHLCLRHLLFIRVLPPLRAGLG